MTRTVGFALAVACVCLLASGVALASPTLRWQNNQHGDFVWIGNTSAQECDERARAPVVPAGWTPGACGSNTSDTAADVFWTTLDDPTSPAPFATTNVTAAAARSTAMLNLPPGATVTYARLYWGAEVATDSPDAAVVLDRVAGSGSGDLRTISADASFSVPKANAGGAIYWYESSADVTEIVAAWGSGAYRVSGIDSVELASFQSHDTFAAWSLVVFYALDSEPFRNLALFDGLDFVRNGNPATVSISGFQVPNSGYDAKLGVMAFEGDTAWSGDALVFEGSTLADEVNPADDFFNGSRSFLGHPVSVAGDLPQMDGLPNSMSGFDLDVVDVTAHLSPGQTSATMQATSSGDTYVLGAFATSIATFEPNFGASAKTFVNLSGSAVAAGNIIEYTIVTANTGNDDALEVVLTDRLPVGITYLAGSLRISAGSGAGPLTDAAGDDQGDYDGTTRTLTVRLGEGATARSGGVMAIGATATVTFRATLDSGTTGTVANQARIAARGRKGNPVTEYPSGNGSTPGVPTTFPIAECVTSAVCAPPRPVCNPVTQLCVGCLSDADCGTIVSGRVCDVAAALCVDGCRGSGGNACPTGQLCTSTSGAVGRCYVPGASGGAPGNDASIGAGGAGGTGGAGGGGHDASPGGGGGAGGGGGGRDAGGLDGGGGVDGGRIPDARIADGGGTIGLDGGPAARDGAVALDGARPELPLADAGARDAVGLGDVPVPTPGEDAPILADAGADAPVVAGAGWKVEGGGCACATGGAPAPGRGALWLVGLAAGLGLLVRRRR